MKKNVSETAQASLKASLKASMEEKKEYPKDLPAGSAQIRIPKQRPLPQLDHKVKRKTQQVSKEWSEEVSHTDQISSHMPPSSLPPESLSLKRIQRFHQKKTLSLLKKMAELNEAAGKTVDHKVSKVHESSEQQKLEKTQDELWRDMMKPQEERQFQISRN